MLEDTKQFNPAGVHTSVELGNIDTAQVGSDPNYINSKIASLNRDFKRSTGKDVTEVKSAAELANFDIHNNDPIGTRFKNSERYNRIAELTKYNEQIYAARMKKGDTYKAGQHIRYRGADLVRAVNDSPFGDAVRPSKPAGFTIKEFVQHANERTLLQGQSTAYAGGTIFEQPNDYSLYNAFRSLLPVESSPLPPFTGLTMQFPQYQNVADKDNVLRTIERRHDAKEIAPLNRFTTLRFINEQIRYSFTQEQLDTERNPNRAGNPSGLPIHSSEVIAQSRESLIASANDLMLNGTTSLGSDNVIYGLLTFPNTQTFTASYGSSDTATEEWNTSGLSRDSFLADLNGFETQIYNDRFSIGGNAILFVPFSVYVNLKYSLLNPMADNGSFLQFFEQAGISRIVPIRELTGNKIYLMIPRPQNFGIIVDVEGAEYNINYPVSEWQVGTILVNRWLMKVVPSYSNVLPLWSISNH